MRRGWLRVAEAECRVIFSWQGQRTNHLSRIWSARKPPKGVVKLRYYTLTELLEVMEPQNKKDKALAVRCIEGLTEYAAELRQKAGPGCQERISALRELVGCLAGYWVLMEEPGGMYDVEYQEVFDRRMAEAEVSDHTWSPSSNQKCDTVYGLYRYALDLIPNFGRESEKEVLELRDLIREIEQFWDFGSPALDKMCVQIEMAMQEQVMWEAKFRIGGIQ